MKITASVFDMRHIPHRPFVPIRTNKAGMRNGEYPQKSLRAAPRLVAPSEGPKKPIGTRLPLTPTELVLIVGLKDADKIGHAGSIPIAGHSRNLSIGRGLVPLPKPHQEIGDVFHGVLSAANCGSRH
jgi:hypothetical protein